MHQIENENIKPFIYEQGSRGPEEGDEFIEKVAGYVRSKDYVYYEHGVAHKTKAPKEKSKDKDEDAIAEDHMCDIGLFGLAVMGQNFALNMASHGFKVCVGNRSPAKVDITVERAAKEGNLPVFGSKNPKNLVAHLRKPRKVVILVQAGKPVDETISNFAMHMEPGDIIIDGGNEWYPNSIRRAEALKSKNILFVGMGISGGEEGARNGPSLMPGGPKGTP